MIRPPENFLVGYKPETTFNMKKQYIKKNFKYWNMKDNKEPLMTKEQFIKRFGEDPVDVLGEDWEEYLEDYLQEVEDEEQFIDRL